MYIKKYVINWFRYLNFIEKKQKKKKTHITAARFSINTETYE